MNIQSEAVQRLEQIGPKRLLLEAVSAIVDGACDEVLFKLGNPVSCDPYLSVSYGHVAFKLALDALIPDKEAGCD